MDEERKQLIIKNLPWVYLIVGLVSIWGSFRVYLITLTTESAASQFTYLFDISPRLGSIIASLLGLGLLICFFGLRAKKGWARHTALWVGLIYIVWALANSYQNLFIQGSVILGITYLFSVVLLAQATYFLLKEYSQ